MDIGGAVVATPDVEILLKNNFMDKEALFQEFLAQYLANVLRELPGSYCAKQIKAGDKSCLAVYFFEEKFLREPFMKALKKYESNTKSQ